MTDSLDARDLHLCRFALVVIIPVEWFGISDWMVVIRRISSFITVVTEHA